MTRIIDILRLAVGGVCHHSSIRRPTSRFACQTAKTKTDLSVVKLNTNRLDLELTRKDYKCSINSARYFSRDTNFVHKTDNPDLAENKSSDSGEPTQSNKNGFIDNGIGFVLTQDDQTLELEVQGDETEENLQGVHEADNRIMDHDDNSKSSLERRRSVESLSLQELARRRPVTLAPYANRSETLQKLVQLGVDLSVLQQVEGMSSLVLCSKFDRDIAPYVKFLHRISVPSDMLGRVLTINPHILNTPMDELELRVGYLVHKQFTLPQVGYMCGRAPVILLMSPEQMDAKLGFLQQTFDLTGDELRQVVDLVPSILPFKKDKIALTRFQIKGLMGLEDAELKQLMMKEPRVYMTKADLMLNNFEYLQNAMCIPHEQVLAFPRVLLHRLHHLKTRHMFLLSRHRAQYDPCQENYVSLSALIMGSDEVFCQNIAKCDLKTYYYFLKTL